MQRLHYSPQHRFRAFVLLALIAGNGFTGDGYPTEVATLQLGHGTRLTDAQGFTLYQYENDQREPGTSTCTDDCALQRPPLIAADLPAELPRNWSVIRRDDGAQQWAYKGMPLYRYSRDSHAGTAFGAGDGWSIAFEPITTPAEITIASTVLGHVLAAAGGQTLYVYDDGSGFEPPLCQGNCVQRWLPVRAPWGALDYGAFSVMSRADGVYQWAYRKQPLFRFAGDAGRGDTQGQGMDGAWRAMILEPAPPVPDWITVVGSDGGALYADANGMTLYSLFADKNATEQAYRGGNHCDEACLAKYWNPVQAETMVTPIGFWSVLEHEDGTLQWAHMGRPLYTLKLENKPGQLYYTTFRQFQWMKPIMYALPALQGVF